MVWLLLGLMLMIGSFFCQNEDISPVITTPVPTPNTALHYDYPRLFMSPDELDTIRNRITREPYLSIYNNIISSAADPHIDPDPSLYEGEIEEDNANIAKNNAFIALVNQNETAAQKAIDFLYQMQTNIKDIPNLDDDINAAQSLHGYLAAYDLLMATSYLSDSDQTNIENLLIELTTNFWDYYLVNNTIFLKLTYNNHNLKTASAIGMAGIMLPDHPDAWKWLSFGMTEIQRLIDLGLFIPGGGYAEGANYLEYGLIEVLPFLIAYHKNYRHPHLFTPVCSVYANENECPQSDQLVGDLLFNSAFRDTMKWWVLIRMPNGYSPPIDDGSASRYMGGLFGDIYQDYLFYWNWANANPPYFTRYSADLSADIISLYDDSKPHPSPDQAGYSPMQVFKQSGYIVFREDWSSDSLYFMLQAERGTMRYGGHEHSDPTNFLLFGYGDFLLQDNGYPGYPEREKTNAPLHHNMILVDGAGPGDDMGPTINGGVDGYILRSKDGQDFDYAEVQTTYKGTQINRLVIFANHRYFFLYDKVQSDSTHDYDWVLHGYAGGDSGGSFTLNSNGAEWDRGDGKVLATILSTQGDLSFTTHVGDNACYRSLHTHNYIMGNTNAQNIGYLSCLYPQSSPESYPTISSEYPQAGVCVLSVQDTNYKDMAIINHTGSEVTLNIAGYQTIKLETEFLYLNINNSDQVENFFKYDVQSASYGGTDL